MVESPVKLSVLLLAHLINKFLGCFLYRRKHIEIIFNTFIF